MEIEKKYLVDRNQVAEILNFTSTSILNENPNRIGIEQYYLNDMRDRWLIRVRREFTINHTEYILTLKSKGLFAREEIEFIINEREYIEAIALAKSVIKKSRYEIRHRVSRSTVYKLEIDMYHDFDFVTCEVEFDSEKDAEIFHIYHKPSWCIEDITEDPKYKNVNLAVPIKDEKES